MSLNLDQLCHDARVRLAAHINRSAGQHARALRSRQTDLGYPKTATPSSSDIYAMCMESRSADQFAQWLCERAGVSFPPVHQGDLS